MISSRDQSCVNDYINHYSGGILNLKCKYAKMKRECKYNRISENKSQGWSAYDGLTVDEIKVKAKIYKFCPYFFEKDKSKHADIVFLPYILFININERIIIKFKNIRIIFIK